MDAKSASNFLKLQTTPDMPKISPAAALLILLSSAISIAAGVLLDHRSPGTTANYRAIYYGARTVFQGADPYLPADFQRVYDIESGQYPSDPVQKQLFKRALSICVNLPSALFLVAPLAALAWGPSHIVWLALIAVSFTLAGLLAYDLGRDYASRLSLILVCFILANSEVLFAVGNTAGLAVSLCVIAIWCFMRDRATWAGILCLSASLLLKPHDSGLLWAYLIVLGGTMRKRAVWSLILCIAIAIPSILWIARVAPTWNGELKANLAATSQRGDISDPGPASSSRKGSADVIIDLQTVFSLFRDDPSFYNPAAILVCALPFAMVLFAGIRVQAHSAHSWHAIAAIAALTMLPSYHRPYDARLLLLAIPASAMLWAQGGRLRQAQSMAVIAAVVLTGDISLALLSLMTKNINVIGMNLFSRICLLPIIRPVPLILLFLAILYSLTYLRRREDGSRIRVASMNEVIANH